MNNPTVLNREFNTFNNIFSRVRIHWGVTKKISRRKISFESHKIKISLLEEVTGKIFSSKFWNISRDDNFREFTVEIL